MILDLREEERERENYNVPLIVQYKEVDQLQSNRIQFGGNIQSYYQRFPFQTPTGRAGTTCNTADIIIIATTTSRNSPTIDIVEATQSRSTRERGRRRRRRRGRGGRRRRRR